MIDFFLTQLAKKAIRMRDKAVSMADVETVMGTEIAIAVSLETVEWLTTTDLGVTIPAEYTADMEADLKTHGRIINPTSTKLARLAEFEDKGVKHTVDGIIYQYSYKFNPRNIKYAYKLYDNAQPVSGVGGLRSSLEAESICLNVASKHLDGLLK